MSTVARPRAIFGVANKDIPAVLARALAMFNMMTQNVAMFASPTIALSAFLALITALSLAQGVATETKAKGSAAARDAKRDVLWTAMEILQKYVQGLSDILSVNAAITLIQAAGLVVAKSPTHDKAVLTAALTATQGDVLLEANRKLLVGAADVSKRVMFNWQWSANGGQTWTSMPPTPLASTQISGLTLMTTYSFRVSVTVSKVTNAWSQPVSLLVH